MIHLFVINIPTFTDEDYDKCLISAKWTKEDTLHLFELCRRFDLRWVIIVDRWEGSTRRTMEEMKERFYNAINELNAMRNEKAEVFCYDAEHEKRRKEQLIKQWNRTEQQVEEEGMLIAELKKIEVRKRERERKAQDLQKLITAGERTPASPAVSIAPVQTTSNIKKSHKSRSQKASSVPTPVTSATYIQDHANIRFPEFRSGGAHLRSQEMKLPTNIGQKKLKNIETVIEKLKLAEYELESLRTRYNSLTGKTFEIEPRMRVRTSSESNADSSNAVVDEETKRAVFIDFAIASGYEQEASQKLNVVLFVARSAVGFLGHSSEIEGMFSVVAHHSPSTTVYRNVTADTKSVC
ncbi:unnamed protein product [Gongylonema pulchrum]|uniref:SANT domain-containing protein n=1 Tax=Gongylonema pulchrum TaxID=637853 RepID=A0A183E7I5_9BILA|nr:unnamed protein product [Gongylonema pulchrum]